MYPRSSPVGAGASPSLRPSHVDTISSSSDGRQIRTQNCTIAQATAGLSPSTTHDSFSTAPIVPPHRVQGLVKLQASQSWVPRALKRRTFFVFIASFIIIIIVSAVLFYYSNRHVGLATSDPKLRYLWTYGPTAVFTILAAFWTKIEYRNKQLAPWRSMAKGPTPAKQSLLVDYVSTWNVKALYLSVKYRHPEVGLAIVGGLILQLIIVFSIGLFELDPRTIVRHNLPGATTTRFANTNLTNDFGGNKDPRAFLSAWSISQYGLAYPFGTAPDFAYQTFNLSQAGIHNATVTATVDAFHPDLDCKTVNASFRISLTNRTYLSSPGYTVEGTINEPGCTLSTESIGMELPAQGLLALESGDACNNGPILPNGSTTRWALLVGRYDVSHREVDSSEPRDNNTYWYNEGPVSAISCRPSFEMRRALVKIDNGNVNVSLLENGTALAPLNVSAWDIWDFMVQSMVTAEETFTGGEFRAASLRSNITIASTFFSIMNSTMPRLNQSSWLDNDFLAKASRKSFQSIASQLVRNQYSEPANGTLRGSASWTENRLIFRPLSFWLILGLLIVMIAISGILCFYSPAGLVPRDPGSIAALAAIIASSPLLDDTLKRAGHSSSLTKASLIRCESFQSGIDTGPGGQRPSFRIGATTIIGTLNTPLPSQKDQHKWWPSMPSVLFRISTVLLSPLAAIAVLEALYQTSRSRTGIANVSLNDYVHYLWVYLPAFLVWNINLCFEEQYFLSTVIEPYRQLRNGRVESERALTENVLGNILIHNFWLALTKRRLAILFASITVLLGGILPIVVAGLYAPERVNHTINTLLRPNSVFNASRGFYGDQVETWNSSEKIAATDPMPSLLLYSNLSYPRWTYGAFALNEFSVDYAELKDASTSYDHVTALIPAVRGRTNCSIVPSRDISYGMDGMSLVINSTKPDGCPTASGSNQGIVYAGTNRSSQYYYGQFSPAPLLMSVDPLAGPGAGLGGPSLGGPGVEGLSLDNTSSAANYHGNFDLPSQCPRGMVTFGKGIVKDQQDPTKDTFEDVTVLHCWPYVEQLVLNVTLSLPSLDIITASPLPADPKISGGHSFFSEAEILQNAGEGLDSKRYPIPIPFSNYLINIDYWRDIADSPFGLFDLFMEAVTWGKDGITGPELAGQANAERLRDRVDEVYGIIVAQLYNKQARIPADFQAPRINGIAFSSNQYRVIQSEISTRILEGVMAAMFVCGALAIFFLDSRRLLPQNPCSIGAAASLVAGSKLTDRNVMPEGAEFLSDKEMRVQGLLKGIKVKLGWWGEGQNRRFGVDVMEQFREKQNSSDDTAASDLEEEILRPPQLPQTPVSDRNLWDEISETLSQQAKRLSRNL